MKFKNPPLIELVADFRWNSSSASVPMMAIQHPGGQVALPPADPARNESFFAAFANGIGKEGFVKAERLVPLGWPFPIQFPVMRFKRPGKDGVDEPTVYQIGAGMFSAHALPPYDNWDKFKPIIRQGFEVMLATRPDEEKTSKFTIITLRYIDRFTQAFTGDVTPRAFIEGVLKVRLDLPQIVQDEVEDESQINPAIVLRLPLKSGLTMALAINNANDPPNAGIVMDTSVFTTGPTDPEMDSAMGVLEAAHDSIRRIFVALTEPIASKMEPEHVSA